jgi:uncharacterized membrane protein HdeD (DUF308 family)
MVSSSNEAGDLDTRGVQGVRRWFPILGVLLMILGAVAVVAAFAVTMATVLLFGVLLLVAGIAQIVHGFSASRWRGFLFHLLGGCVYAAIGGLIVADPVGAAIGLTLLLAFFFAAAGILKTAIGFQTQSGWFTVSGVVDLLLVLLVLLGLPETGTWVIGLFIGVEMLFAGFTLIAAAPDARQFETDPHFHTSL